ncbi:penicillin-binding protein 2 [Bordetella pseudohinzii]|uniref:Peptidoglycan D,D-transpeptidase MrdA n=1 Tax=Bordetella pseudohinzii TaxID=1331258 RepID=A0A0J6F358_9BORD|nr:penicillin-binding protein 2 [Bordetella pseudohinzii]ANY14715.1 penicillin-binding protein 2 [Bordetella pseudohinzii]KMM26915.1 penicillin-binding protein [Bordetella pseudohinzii]KXA76234.1 penicillin-binding protein 2 [Bordetella pseudohinzii]KXA78112.1 penicillin-binding protein 2 [Bordetella pseudohinzii]CUI59799.1 Penicillin-binding protein 2 [Bordetella pseudohinzii]
MFEFKKTSQQQKQRFRLRAWVGGLFALLCFGVLVGRFWFLQVDRYEGFSERADRNRIAVQPIPPRRGEVLDRNGVVLARNYRTYTLEVVPARAGSIDALFERLTPVVYVSPADQRRFKRRVAESSRYANLVLRNNLNETEAAWFSAHAFEFPGVELRARWVREYPQGEVAAHVVGHIGRIAENDLEELEKSGQLGNYRGTDVIGKKGIEKTWEQALHGRTGLEEVEVTAGGRPVRTLRRIDPVPGSDIMLSIDLELQRIAEKAFAGRRGALVALDPDTGEVLAFVSQPSFDPNLFVDGIDVENWRRLNESPDHPLVNRPLSGTYPIGSTYKPFVGLAALELGKRRATDRIPDPGYYEFGGQKFRNAAGAVFGMTDMHKAIVVSSDTYFYSLGPEIGVNALHDFSKQFGFGQITGIDLEGERAGVLPSTDWKRRAYKDRERQRWYAGETISVAVGQGYNAFTLLQLAQATSTLANNGLYRRPHLVHAVRDSRSGELAATPSTPDYRIPLKQANLDVIKGAMADVIRAGTARRAFVGAPYQAAGKTGTAQVFSLRGGQYRASALDERLRDHALFMGFAPVDHPRIAVALIVENAGWGASAAAPVAREVFDYWLAPRREDKIVRPQRVAAEESSQ